MSLECKDRHNLRNEWEIEIRRFFQKVRWDDSLRAEGGNFFFKRGTLEVACRLIVEKKELKGWGDLRLTLTQVQREWVSKAETMSLTQE